MGSYANLKLDVKLKPLNEIGPEVHKLLGMLFMTDEHSGSVHISDRPTSFFPTHPFWKEERFDRLGDSGYEFKYSDKPCEEASYEHPLLKIRCSVKYGRATVENFLDWLTPYVDSVLEPGDFYDDGNENYELSSTVVTFETDPSGANRFLFTEHYDRDGGWSGRYTEEKKWWVRVYPAIKLKNT